jgi:hypothetical protein
MKRKSLVMFFLMALGLVSLGGFSKSVAAGPTPAVAGSVTVLYRTSKNPTFRPLPPPVSPNNSPRFILDGQQEIGDYWRQKDSLGVPNGFLAIAVVSNGGPALTNLDVNYNAELFSYIGLPRGSEYTTLSGIQFRSGVYGNRDADIATQNIRLFPNGTFGGNIAFYRTRGSHVITNGTLSFTIPGTGPGYGTYRIRFRDDSLLVNIGNPCAACPDDGL